MTNSNEKNWILKIKDKQMNWFDLGELVSENKFDKIELTQWGKRFGANGNYNQWNWNECFYVKNASFKNVTWVNWQNTLDNNKFVLKMYRQLLSINIFTTL